jgi:sec-independent protein translocase protein TatA
MSCGLGEWTVILLVVLLVIGIPRLPTLGSSVGRAIRNFKRASKNADEIGVRRREPREGEGQREGEGDRS